MIDLFYDVRNAIGTVPAPSTYDYMKHLALCRFCVSQKDYWLKTANPPQTLIF